MIGTLTNGPKGKNDQDDEKGRREKRRTKVSECPKSPINRHFLANKKDADLVSKSAS